MKRDKNNKMKIYVISYMNMPGIRNVIIPDCLIGVDEGC
jgi:hypothetical protein